MQNVLPVAIALHKKCYSGHWVLKKTTSFIFFSTVKMNANSAEVCRVGSLEAAFQQFPLRQ